MEKITITIVKEKWTGLNRVGIENFLNHISYKKYHFVEDDGELLLYDNFGLIEKGTIIYGNTAFGIIKKSKLDINLGQ